MKLRHTIVISTLILTMAMSAFAIYGSGWGKTVNATGTSQSVAGFTANSVTVLNASAGTLYALVNIDTTTFDARVAAGTAIAIPASMSFTFDSQGKDSIANVCLVTTGKTNVCYIGAY